MFLTAQPHAHVRFRRAIERRALWLAEDAARELPNLPLEGRSATRASLRRARIAEVREGGEAVARAVSRRGLAEAAALRGDRGELAKRARR